MKLRTIKESIINEAEKYTSIKELRPMPVKVVKSGNRFNIEVAPMTMTYDTFRQLGDNFDQKTVDYRKTQNSLKKGIKDELPTDVYMSSYDYEDGTCNFSASSQKDVDNWLQLYKDIVVSTKPTNEAASPLKFVADFFKKLKDDNDSDFEVGLQILTDAYGIKDKMLDEWLNNGGTLISLLNTAYKETSKADDKIAAKARKIIDSYKPVNEAKAVADPKTLKGYKELLPYYNAIKKLDKATEPIQAIDDGDDVWPSFTFWSIDGQKIEVFYDPDSHTVCLVADDDWANADDISIDGVVALKQPATIKEALKPQTISGTFYRVDHDFTHDKGATALDVVNYEADELGNDDSVEGRQAMIDAGVDLSKYPAKDIVWVTKDKKAAKRYLESGDKISEVIIKDGIVVVPDDGDGGMLILKTK